MHSSSLPRPTLWGIVVLLGLGLLIPTRNLPAQSVGCPAVDMNDMPRNCTFLEEHGACLWYALESYEACQERAEGFWEHASCEVGVQVDLLACNLAMPWRLLKAIVN